MNRLRQLLMKEEEDSITRNRQRALVMQAASSHIQRIQEEEAEWGGSHEGRRYTAREREAMDQRLKALYFTSPCRFQGDVFRRRYRMRPHVFDQMMHDVANHDPYFVQKLDASANHDPYLRGRLPQRLVSIFTDGNHRHTQRYIFGLFPRFSSNFGVGHF
ncbi:hypothetical protein ACLB2K_059278 [Fragaria x ananassa]